jgi:YVTN family beta-propeller protein
LVFIAVALLAGAVFPGSASAQTTSRPVLWVGNNWDGTADAVDPNTFQKIARLNIIPDIDERMAEIQMDPPRLGYFMGIRQLVGEGHDQFVDDMFTSSDGQRLFVSRPSLADVAAFEMSTGKIVWRTRVDGYRADHMAISPDGNRLLVSASTAKVVDVIDTNTGAIVARIPSGDQPHENNYSRDGRLIYHASIGAVYTPTDEPSMDATKGERVFEIVDASNYQVLRKLDMGQKLAEAGYKDMSSAVRPMALSPDERYVYFQVSFFHGFVEYDLQEDRVLRLANLPLSEKAARMRREEYLLDSAHHGLAMNPEGTKLCAAGTMSDYAAIVSRSTFSYRIVPVGEKPYWATNSGDGRYCFVSVSGNDRVSVISYATEDEVARIPVGDHPQRMRMGNVSVPLASTPAPVLPADCADRRRFTFRLHRGRGARIVRVEVYVNRKLAVRRRGRDLRRVSLRPLPRSRYRVKVVTTRSNGARRVSLRTFDRCGKSKPSTRRG